MLQKALSAIFAPALFLKTIRKVIVIDAHCHSSSIRVQADAQRAFVLMADGERQGRWALGSWKRRTVGAETFVGESEFTGAETWVRIHADTAALTNHYQV